jgi:hypothetical protein
MAHAVIPATQEAGEGGWKNKLQTNGLKAWLKCACLAHSKPRVQSPVQQKTENDHNDKNKTKQTAQLTRNKRTHAQVWPSGTALP